jgi:hypothetical protein
MRLDKNWCEKGTEGWFSLNKMTTSDPPALKTFNVSSAGDWKRQVFESEPRQTIFVPTSTSYLSYRCEHSEWGASPPAATLFSTGSGSDGRQEGKMRVNWRDVTVSLGEDNEGVLLKHHGRLHDSWEMALPTSEANIERKVEWRTSRPSLKAEYRLRDVTTNALICHYSVVNWSANGEGVLRMHEPLEHQQEVLVILGAIGLVEVRHQAQKINR